MNPFRCRCVAVIAALVVSSFAAEAGAAVELSWDAPDGCPGASRVMESLERMNPSAATSRARAAATIRRVDGRFALELLLRGPSGNAEIHLTAESCQTLADVVALELALAADAEAVTPRMREEVKLAEPPRFGAALFGGGSLGPLPKLSPGARASLFVEWNAVRLEVGGKHLFAVSTTYPEVPEPLGGRFRLTAGFARLCSGLPRVGFGTSVCAGAEVGGIRGSGFGVQDTFATSELWAAFVASPVLRYAFASGLSLIAEGEVAVAMARPEFHARGLPTLFQPERTGASVWVGAGTFFR